LRLVADEVAAFSKAFSLAHFILHQRLLSAQQQPVLRFEKCVPAIADHWQRTRR